MSPDAVEDTVEASGYRLDDQVGFILRQVQQRHALIFATAFDDEITAMQWAVIAKLAEHGECSQNLLGRLVSMDVATIKGVVERLVRRGLAGVRPDPEDKRRVLVAATPGGAALHRRLATTALAVTEETLAPLSKRERETLLSLLRRVR